MTIYDFNDKRYTGIFVKNDNNESVFKVTIGYDRGRIIEDYQIKGMDVH